MALNKAAATQPATTQSFDKWLGPDSRVLVLAPHPDDETLATGGLLQRARARGARVSVLLLTRGDNNPWPQRWLEKRLWIDAQARQRWGERRLAEARRALQLQGIHNEAMTSLDWPDLGLTDKLMDENAQSVQILTAHMIDFAPSLLVIPALTDKHPDHSAAHFLARRALARAHLPLLQCLQYMVHGQHKGGNVHDLALTQDEVACKRHAVLTYQTQVSLSESRLLALAGPHESYQLVASQEENLQSRHGLPWQMPVPLLPAFELLLLAGQRGWRRPLPSSGQIAELRNEPDFTHGPVWFKLRLRWRSPWIFDHWGWRRLDRGPSIKQA